MYQKYQTDAIVLASRELGEADKTFALYTRDFGLVWARAAGVRKETSKMRHALQLYGYVSVGLVRGHHGWRVAGAQNSNIGGNVGFVDVATLGTFARIATLVLRLVAGEEKNEYLFEVLIGCENQISEHAGVIELVTVARVLYALGYLSAEAFSVALFTDSFLSDDHAREVERKRSEIITSINRALSETHL